MHFNRRQVLVGVAAGLLSGCGGKTAEISRRNVTTPADSFAVEELRDWSSGTGLEYKGAFVIDGNLRNTSSEPVEVPRVAGQFYAANGEQLSTVEADFKWDQTWKHRGDVEDSIVDGDVVNFRIVYRPETSETTEYELVVGDGESA